MLFFSGADVVSFSVVFYAEVLPSTGTALEASSAAIFEPSSLKRLCSVTAAPIIVIAIIIITHSRAMILIILGVIFLFNHNHSLSINIMFIFYY